MNNKLNIQDLASAMTDRYGMDSKSATTFVKTVFEIVEEYISKDKLVKIKGLGTFKLVSVSDRESINVNTGERILIAGHSKLSFTPDAALKDAVNRPFADFETTVLRDSTSTEDMERIPSVDVADSLTDVPTDRDIEEEPIGEQVEAVDTEPLSVVAEEENKEEVPADAVVEAEVKETITEDASLSSTYPMSAESIDETCEGKHSTHIWAYTLLTVLLMALAYCAGYYRVHNMLDINLYPEGEVEAQPIVQPVENTARQAKPSDSSSISNDTTQQDTLSVDPVPVKSQVPEEDPAEVAKYFQQVKNGEYWIVGDAGRVHLMKVGETLYSIAEEELGDRNLVRYLIVFNDFEDPNVIHKGDTIRIPKLAKK